MEATPAARGSFRAFQQCRGAGSPRFCHWVLAFRASTRARKTATATAARLPADGRPGLLRGSRGAAAALMFARRGAQAARQTPRQEECTGGNPLGRLFRGGEAAGGGAGVADSEVIAVAGWRRADWTGLPMLLPPPLHAAAAAAAHAAQPERPLNLLLVLGCRTPNSVPVSCVTIRAAANECLPSQVPTPRRCGSHSSLLILPCAAPLPQTGAACLTVH